MQRSTIQAQLPVINAGKRLSPILTGKNIVRLAVRWYINNKRQQANENGEKTSLMVNALTGNESRGIIC